MSIILSFPTSNTKSSNHPSSIPLTLSFHMVAASPLLKKKTLKFVCHTPFKTNHAQYVSWVLVLFCCGCCCFFARWVRSVVPRSLAIYVPYVMGNVCSNQIIQSCCLWIFYYIIRWATGWALEEAASSLSRANSFRLARLNRIGLFIRR